MASHSANRKGTDIPPRLRLACCAAGAGITGLFLAWLPDAALNEWATRVAHQAVVTETSGLVSFSRWVIERLSRSVLGDITTAALCAAALTLGVFMLLGPGVAARFVPLRGRPMKDHSWFILTMRAIGVVLVALGLPHAIDFVTDFCQYVFGDWANMVMQGRTIPTILIVALGGLGQVALGLYLVFGGKWLIRRCLRQVAWQCNMCGYDCRGVTGGRCPECGCSLPGPSNPSGEAAGR